LHELARPRLRAHRLDRARRGADEDDARVLAGLRERCVLREEAVARVDRLGARALGRGEDLLDAEVVLRGRTVAQVVGLVRALDVRRVAVQLRIDGHARDPHLLQGARDADRDLTAVGNQDLAEHRRRKLSVPRRPGWGPGGRWRRGSRRARCDHEAATAISPAPTVSFESWSIRMKLPVRRLLVYGSNASGTLVRRCTLPMSLSSSSCAGRVRSSVCTSTTSSTRSTIAVATRAVCLS